MTGDGRLSAAPPPIPTTTATTTAPPRQAQEALDAAFTRLYEQHRTRVYRYCLASLGDTDEAEDVTSVVFLKLFRFFPRLREGDLRHLIRVVTRNALRDHFRARRSRPWAPDAFDDLPEPVHPGGGPEEVVLARAAYAALLQAVATLSPKQRAVLLLQTEGYTLDQIADRFGWPRGTAHSAGHWARRRMRQKLSGSVEPAYPLPRAGSGRA